MKGLDHLSEVPNIPQRPLATQNKVRKTKKVVENTRTKNGLDKARGLIRGNRSNQT